MFKAEIESTRAGNGLAGGLLAMMLALLLAPSSAPAVNFYTGGRCTNGFMLNLYPFWFSADRRTDKEGHTAVANLGLDKVGVILGGSYYHDRWLFNTLVPVGHLEVDALGGHDEGLGDVQFRLGYFLPPKKVTLLPALAVKTPTGHFDKSRPVNYGDGQTDLMLELFLNKRGQRFAFDSMLRYSVRFENPDTRIKPGNEFIAEGLATCRLSKNFWFGPTMAVMAGEDMELNGGALSDSGTFKVSAGAELFCRRFSRAKISVQFLQDIHTRNANEGRLVMARIAVPF